MSEAVVAVQGLIYLVDQGLLQHCYTKPVQSFNAHEVGIDVYGF